MARHRPHREDASRHSHFEVRTFLTDLPWILLVILLLALPLVAAPSPILSLVSTFSSMLRSLGILIALLILAPVLLVVVLAGEKLHTRWTAKDVAEAQAEQKEREAAYEHRRTREQRMEAKVEDIVTKKAGLGPKVDKSLRRRAGVGEAIELQDMGQTGRSSGVLPRRMPPPPPPL